MADDDHKLTNHHRGALGEARRVPSEQLRSTLSGDTVATLDYWWLHLPGTALLVAHTDALPTSIADVKTLEAVTQPTGQPALDTFAMGVITLADLPGVPPARRQWPWVTHELLVHTLDTTRGPVPFEAPLPWPLMQPHNLSVQFEADDDAQARRLLCDIARAIIEGVLPPEVQAYVPEREKMMTLAPLHQLWQDTVNATAEHLRLGGHS